jgi:hypothetical protein
MTAYGTVARTLAQKQQPSATAVLSQAGLARPADQFGAARPSNPFSQAPGRSAPPKEATSLFSAPARVPAGQPPIATRGSVGFSARSGGPRTPYRGGHGTIWG